MTTPDLSRAIQEALPELIANDPAVRDFVLRTVSNYYAGKEETESRFDQVLTELRRDREEQARKWDESTRKWDENTRQWHEQHQENMALYAQMERDREEQARKWDENIRQLERNREEQARKWEEQRQENQTQTRRYDSTIGALGARWGLYSEASFRNALKGILEDSFGVQVLNVNDFDESGEVFGRPDQVELDLIIKNGDVIVCEIKSSFSKSDMYTFDRKVAFYQKRHERPVTRKLVISPMVDGRAMPVAQNLGIEVYSYADSVKNL